MTPESSMAIIMSVGMFSSVSAIGLIASTGLRAIGRNPDAASNIQTNMILSLAFAEAIAIYGLVVTLILKFV